MVNEKTIIELFFREHPDIRRNKKYTADYVCVVCSIGENVFLFIYTLPLGEIRIQRLVICRFQQMVDIMYFCSTGNLGTWGNTR